MKKKCEYVKIVKMSSLILTENISSDYSQIKFRVMTETNQLNKQETKDIIDKIINCDKLYLYEYYDGLNVVIDDDTITYYLLDLDTKECWNDALEWFGDNLKEFNNLSEFIFDSRFSGELEWSWLKELPCNLKRMVVPSMYNMSSELTKGLEVLELSVMSEDKSWIDDNILGSCCHPNISKVIFWTCATRDGDGDVVLDDEDIKVLVKYFPNSELIFDSSNV